MNINPKIMSYIVTAIPELKITIQELKDRIANCRSRGSNINTIIKLEDDLMRARQKLAHLENEKQINYR
jgi:Mg2+ and Co2+ transporter CorA